MSNVESPDHVVGLIEELTAMGDFGSQRPEWERAAKQATIVVDALVAERDALLAENAELRAIDAKGWNNADAAVKAGKRVAALEAREARVQALVENGKNDSLTLRLIRNALSDDQLSLAHTTNSLIGHDHPHAFDSPITNSPANTDEKEG